MLLSKVTMAHKSSYLVIRSHSNHDNLMLRHILILKQLMNSFKNSTEADSQMDFKVTTYKLY